MKPPADASRPFIVSERMRKFYGYEKAFSARDVSARYGLPLDLAVEMVARLGNLTRLEDVTKYRPGGPDVRYFFVRPETHVPRPGPSESKVREMAAAKRYGMSECSRCKALIVGDGVRGRAKRGHTKEHCDENTVELILKS